jgi:hypothetical protein
MTTAVYLARAALDQVAAAQAVMDAHVLVAASGRCAACVVEWPCGPVVEANATLLRYGRLPRRRPGRTRAQVSGFAWWTAAEG